jgi:MerR family transcriptional regulator/heat shock protein HspR
MISVAADLTGVHPQTLRIYERKALICPQRSEGNTRLYSEADIEQLRYIQRLTHEEGVNLAGVTRIIELRREVERMQAELAAAHSALLDAERQMVAAERARSVQTAIVHVQSGSVMRRSGRP